MQSSQYNVGYFHSEELLESMVTLKEQDYDKYARKCKFRFTGVRISLEPV